MKITQRKDGRYMATIQVAGTRKFLYGSTPREVEIAYREAVKRLTLSDNRLTSPGTRTVTDLIEAWLDTIRASAKPRQISTIDGIHRRYVKDGLGKMRLSRVGVVHVQFLISELEQRGLRRAPSQTHAILKRAFAVARAWRWIDTNPCVGVTLKTYRPHRRTAWTHAQQAKFIEQIFEEKHGLLLAFILTTGCRVSDAAALQYKHLDLALGVVNFERSVHRINGEWVITAPKSEAGERRLALSRDVLDKLRERAQARADAAEGDDGEELVFPADTSPYLHERIVLDAVERRCRKLGLPRITVHGLRHQNASYLLSKGIPLPTVSRRLGHADPSITARIYSHVLEEDDTRAADVF